MSGSSPEAQEVWMSESSPDAQSVIESGAALRRIVTGATWSEGPVWLPRERRVRWSDIPGDRILEVDPTVGELIVHRTGVEFTNGRTLDFAGRVVQCSHGRRAIEIEEDGETRILVDRYGDARLNSPNDVIVASDGAIWFTDPPYGIVQPHEGHLGEKEYGGCHVFRHDPDGGLRAVVTDMDEPNGLAFSPDESVLYVSDTSAALRDGQGNHHIRAHRIVDGEVAAAWIIAVVSPGAPDGFRVDEEGRIWTSSGDGVRVLTPEGDELLHIAVPEVVGNLCFGGDDGRELFIAATTSIYAIRTTTRDAARRNP